MKQTNRQRVEQIIERMAYCIGESKDERRDDTSQIFDEMKQAILALIQEARIDETKLWQMAVSDEKDHWEEDEKTELVFDHLLGMAKVRLKALEDK